jgi:hypothetical protein
MVENFKIAENHKVWVYISSKPITVAEQAAIVQSGLDFLGRWNAHGAKVKGSFEIIINQVLIVSADQSYTQNSGCSIDQLTHFIKGIEQAWGLEFLNRMYVPIWNGTDWQVSHASKSKALQLDIEQAKIMNIMVNDSASFNTEFVQAAKNSWVKNYL